ncbi:MAG: hypothetical protein JWN04_5273, partial [Myxococcaceae bacterium]|nr:hypothetical protein [Myxococcaceae bacterium]
MRRLVLLAICLALVVPRPHAHAAPAVAKAPQKEHRIGPQKKPARA